MTIKVFVFILFWTIDTGLGATKFQCPQANQTTFDKKVATRPISTTSFAEAVFTLRQKDGSPQPWSPMECVRHCMAMQECHSVLVLHQNMECYGLPYVETKSLCFDNDANYFVKQCFPIPVSCTSKLWAIESLSGFRLLSLDSVIRTIPDLTNDQCSQQLLTPSPDGQLVKSAQFQLARPLNSYNGYGGLGDVPSNAIGKCILCREDKFTEPESFRVAGPDTWYKENQCVDDLPKEINRCSYEEYYNQTLKHYDVIVQGITTSECKSRCENEKQFNCRGFTTMPFNQGRSSFVFSLGEDDDSVSKTCLLHSEDVLTHGSWLLLKSPGAVYYRRVACLNVSVVCTPTSMLVTYWPKSDFRGRLYASGHSESCSVTGQGKGQPTKLVIPLNGKEECGVNQAYAITGDENSQIDNKTLMYTLLVIQNNPIIQAQGDRFVRVGCVASPHFNLTLGADISVGNDSTDNLYNATGQTPQTIPASSIINTTISSVTPKVRMYIINEPDEAGQPAGAKISGGAVALGETIELRIEAESPNFDVDILAYHLVASSQFGDSSVLLLDNRGCPTGQVDFPAMTHSKIPTKTGNNSGIVRLSGRFRAFKFPNSHVIKFSVMVQFCAGSCQEVVCETAKTDPVRKTRDVNQDEIKDAGISLENSGIVSQYTPGKMDFDNINVKLIENRNIPKLVTNDSLTNPYVVVASSDTAGRVMEICKEIKDSHDSKIPLELSLIVASNDVYSSESNLIYGENNKILVAAVESPRPFSSNNMICIHEALFISITFIWLTVQVIILAACMIVIKRYRNFVEDSQFSKNYHSFDNLGFDSFSTTRRVHWPDQQDGVR